jgi:hypothetical protein
MGMVWIEVVKWRDWVERGSRQPRGQRSWWNSNVFIRVDSPSKVANIKIYEYVASFQGVFLIGDFAILAAFAKTFHRMSALRRSRVCEG